MVAKFDKDLGNSGKWISVARTESNRSIKIIETQHDGKLAAISLTGHLERSVTNELLDFLKKKFGDACKDIDIAARQSSSSPYIIHGIPFLKINEITESVLNFLSEKGVYAAHEVNQLRNELRLPLEYTHISSDNRCNFGEKAAFECIEVRFRENPQNGAVCEIAFKLSPKYETDYSVLESTLREAATAIQRKSDHDRSTQGMSAVKIFDSVHPSNDGKTGQYLIVGGVRPEHLTKLTKLTLAAIGPEATSEEKRLIDHDGFVKASTDLKLPVSNKIGGPGGMGRGAGSKPEFE